MYAGPVAVCSRTLSADSRLREVMNRHFSNIRFNDQGLALKDAELVRFLEGCTGAIVALEKVHDGVLEALPSLKVISKYGVGLDNLDLAALERRKVVLGWTGGVNRRSVSELALGFMLSLLRFIPQQNNDIHKNIWKQQKGRILSEKTVGIIGFGFIGQDLANLLKPFGCKILVNDIVDVGAACRAGSFRFAEKAELLRESDVVSLHVPYDQSTHNLIDRDTLAKMKPGSILINTSRGNIVDERALAESLRSGHTAGAAMDVFSSEPLQDSPLQGLPGFIGTPHVGGSSLESIYAMGVAAIENLYAKLTESNA